MKLQELVRTENVRRRSSPEYQELLYIISNMALENTVIQDKLTAAFGNVLHFKQRYLSFEIPADKITAIVLKK
jgi:hypothetical protein